MAEVRWAQLEPLIQRAFEKQGRVERADVVDEAYAVNADDDVVDALDSFGSRVFDTPDAARQFLASQGLLRV